MIHGLDLFSGIGGISVALSEWVRPIAYCENDRYCQAVLLSRQASLQLPKAPIWDDITTLRRDFIDGHVDIIYGGFPCQDISVAGHGKGLEGKRSGLFYEIVRLTKEIKPTFVFLENVPAIRTRGLREVVRAFADLRFDCRWTCLSAAELGAPHLRKRWFLLAHASRELVRNESRRRGRTDGESQAELREHGPKKPLADSDSKRHQKSFRNEVSSNEALASSQLFSRSRRQNWWSTEPDVGRVVNGLPHRVDRIKCLGNSVVPSQAKKAFEKLIGLSGGINGL